MTTITTGNGYGLIEGAVTIIVKGLRKSREINIQAEILNTDFPNKLSIMKYSKLYCKDDKDHFWLPVSTITTANCLPVLLCIYFSYFVKSVKVFRTTFTSMKLYFLARFDVLTVVLMKTHIFSYVMPCRFLHSYRDVWRNFCRHLQSVCSPSRGTRPNTETASAYATTYRLTRRHVPEDFNRIILAMSAFMWQ
jgi:hypothetical protein